MCKPDVGGMTAAEFSRVKHVLQRDVVRRIEAALMELVPLTLNVASGPNAKRDLEPIAEIAYLLREARTTAVALAWPSYDVGDFLAQEDPDHDPQCCEHERPPLRADGAEAGPPLHEDVDAAGAVRRG